MIRELKFWTRDLLRGPMAKTPFGYYGSSALAGLLFGGLVIFLLSRLV